MKKTKLLVGILAFIGLAAINFTQSESSFLSKAIASSSSTSGSSSSGSTSSSSSNVNHGTNPSLTCPVWTKTYHLGTGNTGVDCQSGGTIKCISGKCPHEK